MRQVDDTARKFPVSRSGVEEVITVIGVQKFAPYVYEKKGNCMKEFVSSACN